MKNIETPDKMHLGKLIDELRYGKFVIPDFQREFEWGPADVKELIRSIFEDYYIGTLLLWRASKDNQELLNCEPIYGFEGKVDPNHIVLDGQQRLSALYYAFFAPNINFPNRKNRYLFTINLEELLNENFDQAFEYEWLPSRVQNFLEKQEKQFEKKTLPLNILGEKSKALYKWLDGYCQYWAARVDQKRVHKEREKIEHFFEDHISNYDISYIELDRDIEVSKVCDIFTRINNTGIKLTIFDLLNALLRPKDIFLKDMWRQTSEDLGDFDWRSTRVPLLQAMSILKQGYCAPKYLYYLVPGSPKTVKRPDGSKETIRLISSKDEFIQEWDFVVERTKQTIKAMFNHRDFGAIKSAFVPYPTMLPILTAINIEKEKGGYTDKKGVEDKIRKWYWASVFTKNYSSSVESQMTRDFYELQNWFKDDNKLPRVVEQFQNEINNLDLKSENTTGSAIYKAIFNILILKGAKDWATFALPEYMILDDHHIVPQSWGKKNKLGKRIDTILNRTPLSDHTNRSVIADKIPNVYLREMFAKTKHAEEVYTLLESHLISRKAVNILMREGFSVGDYEEFIAEREKTITEEILTMLDMRSELPTKLITPETPFSNKLQIEKVVKKCTDYLYWVDKYFSKSGLEIIIHTFDDTDRIILRDIKILTSIDKADADLRNSFKDFKKELENKGVHAELRVIVSNKIKSDIHDRWIISSGKTYNIPSPDVIKRGQYSEIKDSSCKLPFEKWWSESLDILSDWNRIEQHIKTQISSNYCA